MNPPTNLTQNLSKLSFCLLFPIVFFYGSALEYGVMSPFLGGGSAVITVMIFILLFPSVLFTCYMLKREALVCFVIFIILLLYTGSYLIYHYFSGEPFHQRPDVVRQWMVLIVSWCAVFSIGYFWPKHLEDMDVMTLIYFSIFMSAIILMNPHPDPNAFITSLGRYKSIVGDIWSDFFMSYQGYARSITITGLVLLAVIRHKDVFWVMSSLMLCALFYLGSRSEFIAFLMVFPVLIFYQWIVHPKVTMLIILIIVFILGVIIVAKVNEPSLSRQMEIFNLANSTSYQIRINLFMEALEAINNKPIAGDFSGHIRNHDGVGYYAHNILSSWRQLGFIGFLLYGFLLIWPPINLIYNVIRNHSLLQIDVWRISIVLTVFMLILSLIAKSIFSPFLALGWGIYIASMNYLSEQENVDET